MPSHQTRPKAPWKGYYKWYHANYGGGDRYGHRKTLGRYVGGLGDDDSDDDGSFGVGDGSSPVMTDDASDAAANWAQYAGGGAVSPDSGGGANSIFNVSQLTSGINSIASAFSNVTGTATAPTAGSYAGTQAAAAGSAAPSTASNLMAWFQANPIPVAIGGVVLVLAMSSGGRR
jgi:hypothetical protein